MSLLLFLLVTGMKGTSYIEKLFWVVLSYALASGNYLSVSNGWRTQLGLATARSVGKNPVLLKLHDEGHK